MAPKTNSSGYSQELLGRVPDAIHIDSGSNTVGCVRGAAVTLYPSLVQSLTHVKPGHAHTHPRVSKDSGKNLALKEEIVFGIGSLDDDDDDDDDAHEHLHSNVRQGAPR